MSFKQKMMMMMLKKQLKSLPKNQQDFILELVEKNPDLFTKIAQEIKEKTKAGQDESLASMAVMTKYKAELQKTMTNK